MALIGLGVVMLMQPLSLNLYSYSFVTILVGTLGFVIVSHSRALGLRQDNNLAHDRGPRTADLRPYPA